MAKTEFIAIELGKNAFTERDLIEKAARHKNLTLQEGSSCTSPPFVTYTLDEQTLAFLATRNIKQRARPDCRAEIFTIVDGEWQEKCEGFVPSNYWNFKLTKEGDPRSDFDLRVALSIRFELNLRERGIKLWPQAHGTFVSAADRLPSFRLFRALVDSRADVDVPDIAHEVAESDGYVFVSWTDIGVGGIRTLDKLFDEFCRGNTAILHLGYNNELFDPSPRLVPLFVVEPAQGALFRTWQVQLEHYRAALVA